MAKFAGLDIWSEDLEPQSHQRDDSQKTDQPIRIGGTLTLIDQIRRRAKEQGFQRIRFVTHMEWALEDRPGVDGLLE